MHYVVTKRQFWTIFAACVVVCSLSLFTSLVSLWAGHQWRAERKSREAAISMADRLLAQAVELQEDRQ